MINNTSFFLSLLLLTMMRSCTTSNPEPKAVSLIYFTDWNGKQVGAVSIQKPDHYTTIANAAKDGLAETGAIAIDFTNGVVFITEEWNDRILRKNLNGSGTIEVLYDKSDGINGPSAIELDAANDRIYWINGGSKQIMYGSLDGTASPKILPFGKVDAISYSYSFAIDLKNKKLYVADYDSGILVGNLDGTGTMKKLYPVDKVNVSKPTSLILDVDDNKIYWTDELTRSIHVAPLNGSGAPASMINVGGDTENFPTSIAIDKANKRIYWGEHPSDRLVYQHLGDVSSRTELLKGVESYCIRLNNQ